MIAEATLRSPGTTASTPSAHTYSTWQPIGTRRVAYRLAARRTVSRPEQRYLESCAAQLMPSGA
jgi:hypothetical protein